MWEEAGGKHAGRKPAWESACCEATQATLCHPGRLILIQMLFEMNLYRDCIYSSFFFLNNKKKRKLIGLSNCQILHKNLCFPLHKTTFKKKWNSLPDVSHRPLRSPRCGLHAGQATLLYKFQLIWQQKSFPLSHSPFWNSFGACGFGICGLHGRLYSQWFLEVLLRPYTDFQPCPLPAAISPDSLIL